MFKSIRTTHSRGRRREGWVFLFISLVVISMLVYAISAISSKTKMYDNRFWTNRGANLSDEALNMAALHKNFDVLTSNGWRGIIKHEVSSNGLVMKLIDYVGKPVNGMFIAAEVQSNTGSKLVYNNMLKQTADGEYRSDKLNLKKGIWDLAVTGRDPESSGETDLMFRFEKQITVK